jgi:hypothetical protein
MLVRIGEKVQRMTDNNFCQLLGVSEYVND